MLDVQVPVLVCADGFRAFLHTHCPVVLERFCPTPWCWGGRVQTLMRVLIKSCPTVTYRSEIIRTSDGGQLSLDWVDNPDSVNYPQSSSRPTVLILPGLTGNSRQTYVLHMVQQAVRHGYRMLLLNYLARKSHDSKMIAGLTLSVSWNSFESSKSLEQPINKLLFNRHLTRNLCCAVNRHRKILEKVIDIDHVLQARTIREFDERFTSVLFGYKSCADYYRDASPGYKLPLMTVPVLCLNAIDDPFSPEHAFPVALVQRSRNVALLVTSHGGHIGFLEGLFPHGKGYMDRVFSQFVRAAFEHREDLKEACGCNSSGDK
ncbi:Protein ABHD1 [Bagarius yarrelli]|uniref:Protein ABHD1 n=1 Tax=Bagarius yarrelli TaxID=175774 RepID=A0A556TZB2_BAGYA|nr:Protein ABHD1 [Bagarius yarrelli]